MFESLKRLQLQRRGYSCGRTRRKKSDNEMLEFLRCSPWVRTLLHTLFLGAVAALARPDVSGEFPLPLDSSSRVIGGAIFCLLIISHLWLNHPRNYARNGALALIFLLIATHLGLLRLAVWLVEQEHIRADYRFLVLPFALSPMYASVLLGRPLGLLVAGAGAVLGCLLIPQRSTLPYLASALACGAAVVYASDHVKRRGKLIRAGLLAGVICTLAALLFGKLGFEAAGFASQKWADIGLKALAPLLTGLLAAMFVQGTLPALESAFGITTDISWVELSDLNHPLLKRMAMEAPGTYHHSFVVARLAEAAAEAVGANATVCRVCAYYHDIGKLNKPGYFIENIGEGENPHDDLTPTMSSLVIISHVKDGVDLALKYKLNETIIDVIEQHHGTSLVYFFYRRALEHRDKIAAQVEEGRANEEDIPEVAEKGFRYPDPKPQFKESAIVSLADSIESASRSLQKPTPQKIEQLVEEIVRTRLQDAQLDECDLTLEELRQIRESFAKTLTSMMHNRIAYPKGESAPETSSDGTVRVKRKQKTQRLKEEKEAPPTQPAAPKAGREAANVR